MDLWATPAVELARLIRARELSAAELLAAALARIGEVNSGINAIVTLAAEQASATAAGLDAQAARGSFAGPLHGLPIAVKDLAETAGIRTTFGPPIFAAFVPSCDAPHVARLRQAGAVVLGKTNTPEFGAGSQTFNAVFGPTRNGSDLAASVPNPASFCGVVGLRTTPGLIPGDPLDPRITVTGHPAVSVPAGRTGSGLPVGLQLAGRYGADRRPLEIAAAVMELATPGGSTRRRRRQGQQRRPPGTSRA
jgi:amidase